MASTLSKPPTQPRQSSRPNSTSTSSVVTVQRAASLSSRNGAHPSSSSGLRPQSPNEAIALPTTFSARTLSPEPNRRASAIYPRSDSGNGVREGIGNLNRWSQSTVSSKSSSTYNRRGSLSKRLSGSFSPFGTLGSAQRSPSPNAKGAPKARLSPRGSPKGPSRRIPQTQPPPTLPPIVTLNSLSQAVDDADTPSTVATVTPATADLLPRESYTSSEPDYFGDRWKARSPAKAKTAVQRTATFSPQAKPISPKRVQFENKSLRQPSVSAAELAVSAYSERGRNRAEHQNRRRTPRNGHSRNRNDPSRSSGGTEGESSASSARSNRPRDHRRKTPSQKAMLSKALQKANHAVLLDNAQNFEGAMDAYADACALLQQVMARSSGDDDRRKLEAVRNTYTNRINELRSTDSMYRSGDSKALPEKPKDRSSQDSKGEEPLSPLTDEEDDSIYISTATTTRVDSDRPSVAESRYSRSRPLVQPPPRRQSLQASMLNGHSRGAQPTAPAYQPARRQPGNENSYQDRIVELSITLKPPRSQSDVPAPLSPRRQRSPADPYVSEELPPDANHHILRANHARQDTTETTSWLDTIDESGGSSSPSVHSRSSSIGLRRKRIRAASGATEADVDAAFDAAIEAAYDDGFEPAGDEDERPISQASEADQPGEQDLVAEVRKNVELAKKKVREAEREAVIAQAKEHEKRRLQAGGPPRNSIDLEYGDDDADEEERLLEQLSKDYVLDDADYDIQAKSALPRQSDSSGFSGRTWGSSNGSNFASAGTSLSTVAETSMLPSLVSQLQAKSLPPLTHPPPKGALPPPPQVPTGSAPGASADGTAAIPSSLIISPGVRERRLSGMKAKELKIETHTKALSAPGSAAPKLGTTSTPRSMLNSQHLPEPPQSAFATIQTQDLAPKLALKLPALGSVDVTSRKGSSPLPTPSPADNEGAPGTIPATPALTKVTSADSFESMPSVPDSPGRFNIKGATGPRSLKKNFSSSSLKNKILSVSVPESSDQPNPPGSSGSSISKQRQVASAAPELPSPTGANFMVGGIATDEIHVFDSDIHSPTSPGSPNPLVVNAPLPLEPCPESAFLRPFWLLRCIYQTIAHPRGGYLSNRLFVPRDIWKVKTTKLKSVEEKVASCDLLTATLLKLAQVDTLDADAVLKEMQFLESVMEQTQNSLSKRLGSEVGTMGAPWLSKGVDDIFAPSETLASKSTNTSTKSYLSSWKKLRSKNSAGPGYAAAAVAASKDGSKDVPPMKSLPMTTLPHSKFPRRDLTQVQCGGPNANYMAALAKLCDAVQILDQIARQVEDPGLKHSSQTHVGLELSTRHAAEFFGFYICRFVINDVGIMLDKFIKRSTEWVNS